MDCLQLPKFIKKVEITELEKQLSKMQRYEREWQEGNQERNKDI